MACNGFERERIDRFFQGDYSERDSSYVDEVFCDDTNKDELKHHLLKQFYELQPEEDDDQKNLDHILYEINYEINQNQYKVRNNNVFKILRWTYRIAAIIILPVAIYWGSKGYINNMEGKSTWVEIIAPAWTKVQFCLPDGTIGWLNSNSSVKYNGNFISDRNITLEGEAYFDVFKDKQRPFVVNTSEVSVKVLGTRFNIASYENEKNVEVVLEEGSMRVEGKEINKSIVMRPNDMVIYDKKLKDISTEVIDPQKYISWTEGKLVFRNDPLDVIARRLERWYDIDVEVNGFLSEDIRWRATFQDDSLEQVLYLLKRSLPVDYKIISGSFNPDETFAKKKVIITLRTK